MRNMFYGCTKLEYAELPTLTGSIYSYGCAGMFYNCTSLLSAGFPKVEVVGSGTSYTYEFYQTFYGCSKLSSVDFSSLKSIAGNYAFSNAFYNCTALTSITFQELTGITAATSYSYGTFYNCNTTKDMFFPKLSSITNNYMFYTTGNNALTGLHFAKVNETAVRATSGFSSAWGRGAANVTISFDLNTDGTVWDGVDGDEY